LSNVYSRITNDSDVLLYLDLTLKKDEQTSKNSDADAGKANQNLLPQCVSFSKVYADTFQSIYPISQNVDLLGTMPGTLSCFTASSTSCR